MEIRVTIAGGNARVETISALEDLWHDFQFFKQLAIEHDGSARTPTDRLIAKRYRRVALLTLLVYFEGVLNRWLAGLLPATEWVTLERKGLERKIEVIQRLLPDGSDSKPEVGQAKSLRNTLVHLKPGCDGELYDSISQALIEVTETSISAWLTDVGGQLHLERHPDTEAESRDLRRALGRSIPGSTGYTGTSNE